jgi:hypothetical protein
MIPRDQSAQIEHEHLPSRTSDQLGVVWLFVLGAGSARSLLATIPGSTISIAATAFSITIVALSLVAGQVGLWLLRIFMRDHGTQLSPSMFSATLTLASSCWVWCTEATPRPSARHRRPGSRRGLAGAALPCEQAARPAVDALCGAAEVGECHRAAADTALELDIVERLKRSFPDPASDWSRF